MLRKMAVLNHFEMNFCTLFVHLLDNITSNCQSETMSVATDNTGPLIVAVPESVDTCRPSAQPNLRPSHRYKQTHACKQAPTQAHTYISDHYNSDVMVIAIRWEESCCSPMSHNVISIIEDNSSPCFIKLECILYAMFLLKCHAPRKPMT